jgi:gas vesicle protein
MAIPGLLIGSAIAGGIGSIAQGIGAAKQGKAQSEAARKAGEAAEQFTKSQLRNIESLSETQRSAIAGIDDAFKRSKNAFEFIDQTDKELGGLFGIETERKRENLDFITGDTQDDLRTAQQQNAELAAGNFSGFLDSLRADTLGVLATTEGRPVGAFENLSARNQLVARSRGLSNALAISDFFAREGTVDPPNALSVFGAAQGIAEFESREDQEELLFRERQLDRSLGVEDRLFGLGFETEHLGLLAETQALQGAAGSAGLGAFATGSSLQGIGGALGSTAQVFAAQDASRLNRELLNTTLELRQAQLAAAQNSQVALQGTTGAR